MSHSMSPQNKADDDSEDRPTLVRIPLPYATYESIRTQRITTFYLNETIGRPGDYTEMIHKIRTAGPADIVYIHLNTPGGRLDTGIQLINAMKDSEARIIAVLDSKAYSLGTLIFLAADEFIVHENCMFMIHNYSSATVGKGNEQKAEMQATEMWFGKLAKKYYYPFLSMQELQSVLDGRDIWMDSDEIRKRLKNMVRIQEEALAAANTPKAPRRRRKGDDGTTDDPHVKGVGSDAVLPLQQEIPVQEIVPVIATATKTRRSRKSAAAS